MDHSLLMPIEKILTPTRLDEPKDGGSHPSRNDPDLSCVPLYFLHSRLPKLTRLLGQETEYRCARTVFGVWGSSS
jgi:hypothetical protein